MATDEHGTRGRGRSAGIDAQRIIEAARGLPANALTMQAVARELGVDRTALNYHVRDRESLLGLVAKDAFAREFSRFVFPVDEDWRVGCRAYVRAMRDALVATGTLAAYFRYDTDGGLELLRPAELLLEKLFEAGFSDDLVAQGSLMLAHTAMALARDLLFIAGGDEHPQLSVLHFALDRPDVNGFPALRRLLMRSAGDAYGEEQFDTTMRIFVLGMERLLPER